MSDSLRERLGMEIGGWAVGVAETKELAPTTKLAAMLDEVGELETKLAAAEKRLSLATDILGLIDTVTPAEICYDIGRFLKDAAKGE